MIFCGLGIPSILYSNYWLAYGQPFDPPVEGKFAAYGIASQMPNGKPLYTVLEGTVTLINSSQTFGGSDFEVIPDQNYRPLLMDGNLNMDNSGVDAIHVENGYTVDSFPYTNNISTPTVYDPNTRTNIPIKMGDHIILSGLYVIDYAHFCDYMGQHVHNWGIYTACDGHAEIHPYNITDVRLATPYNQPSNVIWPMVVAPIYPQFFCLAERGQTQPLRIECAINDIPNFQGKIVEKVAHDTNTAEYIISAGPQPAPGSCGGPCFLRLYEFNSVRVGSVSVTNQTITDSQGNPEIKVDVTVSGTDINNPSIYNSELEAEWVSSTNPTPSRCLIATAAFGSDLAPEVQFLRDFRDNHLQVTASGSEFMKVFNQWYYSFSPNVADYERHNLLFRDFIRGSLYPLLGILFVAEKAFFLLNGNYGTITAGLVSVSMMGAVYISPLTLLLKKVRSGKFGLRLVVLIVTSILVSALVSILSGNQIAITITSLLFLLSIISLSSLATVKMSLWIAKKLHKKFNNLDVRK